MTGIPRMHGYGSYFLICEIISATDCLLDSREAPTGPWGIIPTPDIIFIRDTDPRTPLEQLDKLLASRVPWVYTGEVGFMILGEVIEGLWVGGPETDTGQV
eukprot:CAMPEP_0119037872 /NCGR_PEP_ID=MMETSP1177-20130426/6411_1 /TAXON_ID=2985 /ORGANISM="Ochromonas sp, Strain CCMP1899" /LENGTH=100 /DNA_ID=CAMNT_0006999639 /DNA_START=521 /DNA_END=823 /DNA_ORIENTATION=-